MASVRRRVEFGGLDVPDAYTFAVVSVRGLLNFLDGYQDLVTPGACTIPAFPLRTLAANGELAGELIVPESDGVGVSFMGRTTDSVARKPSADDKD